MQAAHDAGEIPLVVVKYSTDRRRVDPVSKNM